MTSIVIDTNVIVSAILTPTGKPAQIASLVSSNRIKVFYSVDILREYKRVLAYERLKIHKDIQAETVEMITKFGILIDPPTSTIQIPDETDRIFYDTAKASNSILITGNIKHYPAEFFVMKPSDFLSKI